MARKSRKDAVAEPIVEVAPLQIFPTAIYARLSVENSGKSENVDVITNQIEICKSYIADRPYLNLVDTYIDNGRTGTVFDRPEFNRLMTDIKSGRMKCLVVRDLSRLGVTTLKPAHTLSVSFLRSGYALLLSRKTTITLILTAQMRA